MRLVTFDILEVRFPFRVAFGHAHTSRTSSTNVLVRAETDQGAVGFGECVPRDYVTGETPAGAVAYITQHLTPALVQREVQRFEDAPDLVREVFELANGHGPSGAARCAVELAVLDASGKAFGRSVGELLGPRLRARVAYSGVVPFLSAPLMLAAALAHRLYGVTTVKLKVGRSLPEDLRNLKILRTALGRRADIRVDANAAWEPDEAIASIRAMERYGIRAVEQPVAKDDFAGLRRVADAVTPPIMADESLCTLEDAHRLADARAVDMFNIRLSKCGGLLGASQMADIAAAAGLTCQLGAHPGESAILSAAGRLFAAATASLRYLEGSAGPLLLKQDIGDRSVVPGRGGWAPVFDGPGLGIRVDDAKLAPFIVDRHVIR